MPRSYDSSRRKQAAEKTRKSIVEAALKLHWEGITEFEPLALEAGCSLPTLRKHYPNKEAIFGDCTRAFADSLAMPDLAALGEITEPVRRFEESVSELCRIHEAMFGYAWLASHMRKDSPTLDATMSAYDEMTDAFSQIIAREVPGKNPLIRGLVDFLTYRALRLSGDLTPEQARNELTAALRPLVLGRRASRPVDH